MTCGPDFEKLVVGGSFGPALTLIVVVAFVVLVGVQSHSQPS